MNGLTGHMTKRVFYDGGGADTPARKRRSTPDISLSRRPHLAGTNQRAQKGGTVPRTSPKARTRSDAAPPPKNAPGYSSKLKFRCGK